MLTYTEALEHFTKACALCREHNIRLGQALFNVSSEELCKYILTLEDQSTWYNSKDFDYCYSWFMENVVC